MLSRTLRPLRAANASRIIPTRPYNVPIAIRCMTTESVSSPVTESPILGSQRSAAQTTSSTASSDPKSDAASPKPPQNLPYHVSRNRMNNMAVYERRYRGGNLKKTLLKKGEGNLQALKFDVMEALGLTEKDVKVNNVTNHVEIKGHRRVDVVQFLTNMGF